ncbi:hypothetical protein EDD21DRAFT_385863 [Dissophora ornata]|nr:hypothetical protein EDD21DRAFT_385863 [Dissophora ornata]
MGIYKNLFAHPEHVPSELVCLLCTQILYQPYQVFCVRDHVFCRACLDSYVQECNQDQELLPLQSEPPEIQLGNQLESQSQSGANLQETHRRLHQHVSPSSLSSTSTSSGAKEAHGHMRSNTRDEEEESVSDVFSSYQGPAVECPECQRTRESSTPLRVSSFRPAKFVERMIQAQRVRCPTTMARSCQWVGPMKDVSQHLGMCGFAVEVQCPHQSLGCTFRAAAIDIAVHLLHCPFSPRDQSRASNAIESADSSRASVYDIPQQPEPLSPPQSSPPMCPADQHQHQYQYQTQFQDPRQNLGQTGSGMDGNCAEGCITPPMNSALETELSDGKSLDTCKTERMEEEFDQDDFSVLLEDLDMADMTISPVNTSTPNRYPVAQDGGNGNTSALSVKPGWRRRVIVEEDEFDIADETMAVGHSKVAQEHQHPAQLASEHTGLHLRDGRDLHTPCDSQALSNKSRVLKDATTPIPTRIGGVLPTSSPARDFEPESALSSQEAAQNIIIDLAISQSDQVTATQQQQQFLRRSPSGISANSPQVSSKRRMLQLQGPWQRQVNRGLGDQSRSPSVTTTDITSVVSEPECPQSPSSPSSRAFAQHANLTKFFALTQPPRFYVAEPSAYLPLLVHEPRYLRPRRKKVTRGLARARFLTPIVRSGSHREQSSLYNDILTPDITSPENSLASASVQTQL